MKGVIFIALNEMVETRFGIATWEQLLSLTKPESAGIYTSVSTYKDEELFSLVVTLSQITGTPPTELVRLFGEFLFNYLNKRYPLFAQRSNNYIEFIHSIDSVIHTEVRKLYNDPGLPSITIEAIQPPLYHLHYASPRKLCVLAEGLLYGAAGHFNTRVEMQHLQCMHDGHEKCVIALKTGPANE